MSRSNVHGAAVFDDLGEIQRQAPITLNVQAPTSHTQNPAQNNYQGNMQRQNPNFQQQGNPTPYRGNYQPNGQNGNRGKGNGRFYNNNPGPAYQNNRFQPRPPQPQVNHVYTANRNSTGQRRRTPPRERYRERSRERSNGLDSTDAKQSGKKKTPISPQTESQEYGATALPPQM